MTVSTTTVRGAASEALGKLDGAAVLALIAALKSPHLYQRAYAIEALSRIKPLPDDATQALAAARDDKSEIVEGEAADALKGVKVDAGAAIYEERLDGDNDFPQAAGEEQEVLQVDQSPQNTLRYTKAELLAPIPPDPNHEYPNVLKYLVPVVPAHSSATHVKFLVTVHAAKDGEDRVAIWEKTGADQYEQVVGPAEAGPEASFEEPVVSSSKVLVTGDGRDHYETALFIDLPMENGRGSDDAEFAVDHDHLEPVETGPWGSDVDAKYTVIKEMRYDAPDKVWLVNWKVVVVDPAKRGPRLKR